MFVWPFLFALNNFLEYIFLEQILKIFYLRYSFVDSCPAATFTATTGATSCTSCAARLTIFGR
jgi:hypothetical protein